MFFFLVVFCFFSLLILKCTVLLAFWFLRKFKNVQISCQSSGLVWYKNFVFASNSNFHVSITSIWLSSCYIDGSFSKPLVIGLGGVSIRFDSKFKRLPPSENGALQHPDLSRRLRAVLRILKKFTSLCVCDLNVEQEDQEKQTGVVVTTRRLVLDVEKELFENVPTFRLQSEGTSICYLRDHGSRIIEATSDSVLLVSATLQFPVDDSRTPTSLQSLKVECPQFSVAVYADELMSTSFDGTKPTMDLRDDDGDFDEVVRRRRPHGDAVVDDDKVKRAKHPQGFEKRLLVPAHLQVGIRDVRVVLLLRRDNRELSTSWREISLVSEASSSSANSLPRMVKVESLDFRTCVDDKEVLSVEQIGCHSLLSKEEISVTLNLRGGHVSYVHEEVVLCSCLIGRLVSSRSAKPSEASSVKSLLRGFASEIVQAKFYSNVYVFSLAVPVVDGNGRSLKFIVGLPGARVVVLGMVQDGLLSDCTTEVEMTSTYVRLQDDNASCNGINNNVNVNNNVNTRMESELSAKRHFWGTPMYLGLLFLKVTRYGNHESVECMVDNLRFESSWPILAAVQLLEAELGGDLAGLSHWLRSRRGAEGEEGRKSVQLFLQMSCLNVFICHENDVSVMLRCDSASVPLSSPSDVSLILFGVKATHFIRTGKFHSITKSSDITNEILSLPMGSVNFNLPLKNMVVEAAENVLLVWSYSAHLCLTETLDKMKLILKRGSKSSDRGRVAEKGAAGVEVMLFLSCSIRINMSSGHFMKWDIKNLQLEQTSTDGIIIKASRLQVSSDEHPFLSVENLKLKSDPRGEKLAPERSLLTCPEHLVTSNRSWNLTAEEAGFVFAYDYNFAAWLEEVKCLRKWARSGRRVSYEVPILAPDIFVSINCISIQMNDDPFEVKLGDNYELLCDESLENEKRMAALNKRIEEFKSKNTLIPDEKLVSLYASLSEKMSQVYVQRADQMYSRSPMRTSLCSWVIRAFELVALADPSMTRKQDILDFMVKVNRESPIPEDLSFHSAFLRRVRCTTALVSLHLRDFPHPMLLIEDWFLSGKFCGAEANGLRGQKMHTIDLGHPWGSTGITKNIPPMKFYYDIRSELKNFSMTYGSCWEPIVAQVSLSMNRIFRPGSDPSPTLPFWDKWRHLLHGNLVINMDRGSWMCHASLDPSNTTEFMDWTWSDLVFKWVTGEVSFDGDLEILLRTASKYDECCFLKWNSLKLTFKPTWRCKGDPNDHHSVLPCSPEYVAALADPKGHDTYSDFRSSSLVLGCSMKSALHPSSSSSSSSPLNFSSTSPGDVFSPGPSTSPRCLFYSSTIRWLDCLKVCLGRVSRPIRRGRYFNTPITGKPKFTRHISCLNFNLALPSLNCSYWSSFRRSFGVELNSGPIRMDTSITVETKQPAEGLHQSGIRLTRRAQRVMGTVKLQARLESVAVWLSSQIHQRKTKFKPLESEKSFLLSVDKVNYQRIEEQQAREDSEVPLHQVEVHDLKACWTPYNRDIVFALHDSYSKSQMLQRNLSADALKGVKVESSCQTPKKTTRPLCHQFSFSSPGSQPPHADALLQKLISESESKFVAAHEEITGAGVDMEHLQGYQVCQMDDVVRKNWIVTLVNSQVMLSGCETSGCIIVSTPRASLLSCLHQPVLTSNHQLRSKTTMVGSIESMQYYATITDDIRPENIRWLTTRDIEERKPRSSESNSLTLENIIQGTDDVETDISHIQRIISRCGCQFYWSWYGELEEDVLDVPLQIDEYSDVMKTQEGIDAFTLIHHDLNICTNSVQYATALDIVNNLLLHVEPKKKEQLVRLMDMRFKLQLSSDSDQKTPIFKRQNQLRQLTERMRSLEREVYLIQRINQEEEETRELVRNLEETKEQINFLSEELALMLSCYRESLLQASSTSSVTASSSQKQSSVKREAMMTRKIDLYLQHVEWRLNESDGQIGISHIVLSNFLYTKTMHENDCGSHQLELGWCHVTNLLPEDQAYKDVLVPQEPLGRSGLGSRRSIVRVLCKFKSPVGGISVKEHLEVNVAPLTIQMTARFYSVVMAFFFPGKPVESDDESVSDLEESQSTTSLTLVPQSKKKFAHLRKRSSVACSVNDIDKMKERAAKNNMFIYIKISEVSLKVSYKSDKDKHIMNIRDFQFLSPMLEYHNQTWSWHDLTMTLKRECKKVIISQALRQKLHIKSKSLFGDMMTFPRGVTGSEEDTDKTKLLLGLSVPETKQRKTKKRSLFGK